MKKLLLILSIILGLSLMNACKEKSVQESSKPGKGLPAATVEKVTKSLIDKYGNDNKMRIEKGVAQAAALWIDSDGKAEDFEKFCLDNFIADEAQLDELFNKLQTGFEILWGHMNKVSLELKQPLHLDGPPIIPLDEMFGSYEPGAHVIDDFYTNKIAFLTIINFPFYSLKEKTELGVNWDRKRWAYARMGDIFTSRVPAALIQKVSEATTMADTYISEYNIYMGNLVDKDGKTFFPADMKLISHWGLRDELKSQYGQPDGLTRQQMVYSVMKRIIDQSIPKEVINNKDLKWDPVQNIVTGNGKKLEAVPEPDTRYQMMITTFNALRAIDPYQPNFPDYIKRNFEYGMEIPQEEVEKLFIDFVSSPQVKEVATFISTRLGRPLEPFDIWYDGFKPRSGISQEELDGITRSKYPNTAAFEKDMPSLMMKLGWNKERSDYISSKIQVDPARGSGHAWPSAMKSDKSHLRTRVDQSGMNYKGYNIAVHEFGHNVEQTITLHDIDYYTLSGVPNTSFTEALAFLFQKRDLELLGKNDNSPDKESLMTLDNFWQSYEIMGVSLVDMNVWKWLYKNPDATPAQLKDQVIATAKDVWNKYYAPVFGQKDETILAIYSHMIDYPLYLSAYPIGHIIDFQVDQFIRDKNFAAEVDRMYKQGKLIPQIWMKGAVGEGISIQPILNATSSALTALKK